MNFNSFDKKMYQIVQCLKDTQHVIMILIMYQTKVMIDNIRFDDLKLDSYFTLITRTIGAKSVPYVLKRIL